jgi:PAS domain S-box-containing protein
MGRDVNEQNYRRLFDESRDAIVVARPDGAVLDANAAAIELFGYSSVELSTLTLRALCYDQGARDRFAQQIGRRAGDVRDRWTKLRRKDGTIVDATIMSAGRGADHRDDVFIIRDVTATRMLEQEMQQVQKMEAVGRLAGGIAHDFNNLLTAISGYTELLITALAPSDPRIQDAYEIRRAALSAGRLTQQLLGFSRKQRARTEIVDLNGVVAQTAAVLKRSLGDDIVVTLGLDPALNPVKADPGHLEQIVLNLAVNARDAMPAGGRLTMTTSMHLRWDRAGIVPPGAYVRLRVADTGCGIPEAIQAKVFEPFFTTKGSNGTGIGLATVYGIVKQSGGFISLSSIEGCGTTFTIDLPATSETVVARDAGTDAPRFIPGCATILVVEDDPRVREITELILRRAGHDVVVAPGPLEAIATLRAQRDINLMLTDIVMPDMNGYDLADEARKIAPDLRVLYMSGFASDEFRRVVQDPFVPKPFSATSLTSAVETALAARAAPAVKV